MNKFVRVLAVFGMIIWTGCEGAKAPLGPPNEVHVDSRLEGEWVAQDTDGSKVNVKIWGFNDSEYYLEYLRLNADGQPDDDLMRLRGFSTPIATGMYANIACINCEEADNEEEDEGQNWFFFVYEITPNGELRVQSVDDDVYEIGLKDLSDVASIRAYVEAHATDKGFLQDEVLVFKKAK